MPNVHLTEQMSEYVEGQVASGAYSNVSEVIRAGVRLLMEQDGAREFFRLRAELQAAASQAERGETVEFDFEEFIASKT